MRITDRDIKIIKYVYEMKFCASDDVHEMFFAGEKVRTKRYSFVRLKRLVDEGYLRIFKNNLYRSGFYFISNLGLNLLRVSFRDELFPKKAPSKMDTRYFEHDHNVAKCRTYLEREGLAKNWVSERVIVHDLMTKNGSFQSKYMLQNLQKSMIPDGLFETRRGETCAFELEFSLKSNRDLKAKLSNLHKEASLKKGLFSRVLIIAGSQRIESSVLKVTRELGGDYFKVMPLEEIRQ